MQDLAPPVLLVVDEVGQAAVERLQRDVGVVAERLLPDRKLHVLGGEGCGHQVPAGRVDVAVDAHGPAELKENGVAYVEGQELMDLVDLLQG